MSELFPVQKDGKGQVMMADARTVRLNPRLKPVSDVDPEYNELVEEEAPEELDLELELPDLEPEEDDGAEDSESDD